MSVPEYADRDLPSARFAELRAMARANVQPARPAPAATRIDLPYVTTGLLFVLLLAYAMELALGVGAGDPTQQTLIASGALDRTLVVTDGQWWRIATAMFLHANMVHIVGNGVVLLVIGWMLERLIGRAWLALTYLVSGLGGAMATLLLNPVDSPVVGASGAIMGLLAAAFVLSFHPGAGRQAMWLRLVSVVMALPALIPIAAQPEGGAITDFSAHFGGAAAGALMGFVMLAIWPEDAVQPQHTKFASRTVLLAVCMVLVAFGLIGLSYPAAEASGHSPNAMQATQTLLDHLAG